MTEMIEDDIAIHLIAGIMESGRRILGEDAIKAANEVEGLDVRPNGEIVVTGSEDYKIIGDLCRAFEKAMRGKLVVDVEVRLNLKRGVV